jgi:methionyl-tRNA formyltransferase
MHEGQATAIPRLRLIVMGTGPFAVPAFEAVANEHEIALVVTRPARQAKSRGGEIVHPVTAWAESRGFAIEAPASINDPATVERLRALRADLSIVCDYGQILKPAALSATRLGAVNLHGSLLPRHRGAAPVQWSILSGDRETGVTVIHMTPGLDAGPILAQRHTTILDQETAGALEQRLASLGPDAVQEAIELLGHWNQTDPLGRPQDASHVTRAPRFDKASGRIDFTEEAASIARRIRALQPWPGAFLELPLLDRPAIRVQLFAVHLGPADPNAPAGTILPAQPGAPLRIACRNGTIVIDELQPAGKRRLAADDFARGYPLAVGQPCQ